MKNNKTDLFNTKLIHECQMAYLVMSVFYLMLLSSAFFVMLYAPNDIKFIANYLLLVVACVSFIAQLINITCNILNIVNIKREQKRNSKVATEGRKEITVAVGFIGESTAFLGIAAVVMMLGAQLLPFGAIALPLRILNIFASTFSIVYGSILLYKSIKTNSESQNSQNFNLKFHAKWVLINSILFVLLGFYNLIYETVLHEVLDFPNNHHLATLLKATVFLGYVCVLSSIFFSQFFDMHATMDKGAIIKCKIDYSSKEGELSHTGLSGAEVKRVELGQQCDVDI